LEGRQGEYRFRWVWALWVGNLNIDGKITVNPVRVQGSYTITDTRISHYWEHLKDLVSFQIISGTTDVSGEYTVEIVDGQLNARLENGAFELDDFKLVEKAKEEVLIALPTLSIQGIAADLSARRSSRRSGLHHRRRLQILGGGGRIVGAAEPVPAGYRETDGDERGRRRYQETEKPPTPPHGRQPSITSKSKTGNSPSTRGPEKNRSARLRPSMYSPWTT
jgi:hypothetical protein